jgi:transposase
VDAQRIAQFTCLHQRLLKPMQLPPACLLKLKNPGGEPLMAFRERLVKISASLKKTIQDLKDSAHLVDNRLIIKESEKQLKLIEQQISHTDREMEATIRQDEQVWKRLQLAKSVVVIGLVTAVAFVIHTQNFTAFENGRQFAARRSDCYAGVAPFEWYATAAQLRH